ncbi:Radical SAM superfamily enzyme, MoaA/NifB/PqqE/SkfB family [Proteiniborus ethanoligenes]|uniref:Radical SAM superfamily enzyme, MoaA/NifB/PqqE/SkfB family n=1 Tax=Proteiniborus ethanoligenes TaxID=415015 RepID=A0A1H3QKS2_9FIRM|nr:radical SAM protein [Proteiniborus ethanoligenes]SDZ13996.1 Radical SAM superfamily enzyme, MoaA/NifB/PqqE/SkfB family [Proteiniborus ethanoligenes]
MGEKTIVENIQSFGLKKVLNYLDSDPDANIPKILDWVEKFDREGTVKGQLKTFRDVVEDKGGNWYKLIKSLWTDVDDGVRKTLFENFIINATIVGGQRQEKTRKENNCNVPWAILMDPTSACNLHCTGCWAAEYGNRLNMDIDTLDNIIKQGKEMGIYMYIYSGGEPLVRKKDIISLCEKHKDCAFLAFTNGTLIDEDFANEMLRVKNFVPAISVEGFEEETDFRRGEGTYKAVIKAMEILKSKKLPFGISCCYTSKNTETIGSEEYFDDMIEKGAKFAWLFTYMPVGKDAVPELLATPEQREYMYHQVRKFRSTKPLFTMDFWNDGEYVNGCIAGGRNYLHINANGDIEPCAFIHYSDSNIRDKSLLEAFKSPLFMQYRENQPFNNNHLRPCPLLDNPGRLTAMVERSRAKSTDMENPEDVRELSSKCEDAAKNWAPVANKLWNR